MQTPVSLGILGCAGVIDYAMLAPAREEGAIAVAAVASRDAARAEAWANQRGIPRSYGSYDELLAAGGFDAVYVPLPNALHHEWAIRALRHGYPVICEKPLAANAAQAADMVAVAIACGQPLMEAMHWRFHPLAARVAQIIGSGEIGAVRRVEMHFQIPPAFVPAGNIRHDYALGGGALMDQGCYCISFARFVIGSEPVAVTHASAQTRLAQIDETMAAELLFPDGVTAGIEVTMVAEREDLFCQARIVGTSGDMVVNQPFMPHLGAQLVIETPARRREELPMPTSSYVFQARAIAALVSGTDRGNVASLQDSIANMVVIDAIYEKAGLRRR